MEVLHEFTAFIPAAGYGRRMGNICNNNQKCMLPIWEDKKPILYYIIQNLKNSGCKKIVIAVNHCKEQIIEYFNKIADKELEITYVEGNFSSTYDTLIKSIKYLPEKFIYTHGDMIFQKQVYFDLLNKYKENNISTISVMPNTYYQMTHPRVRLNEDNVQEFILQGENLNVYPYMYLGAAIYNKSDFVNNYNGDHSGMTEKMILQKFVKNEPIKAIIYNAKWRHFMNEQDWEIAKNEKKWLE